MNNKKIAIAVMVCALFNHSKTNTATCTGKYDRAYLKVGVGAQGLTDLKVSALGQKAIISMKNHKDAFMSNMHMSLEGVIMANKNIGGCIGVDVHDQYKDLTMTDDASNTSSKSQFQLKSFIDLSMGLFLRFHIKNNLSAYGKLFSNLKRYNGYTKHSNIKGIWTNGFGSALGLHYRKNDIFGMFCEAKIKYYTNISLKTGSAIISITPPKEFGASVGFTVNLMK
ncbi:hypothetical protein [Candidatus Cytomitobacter primus]|uniref:Outer membrane protein beta-barrel domain-containing protein n=1 Tax=Candidatus Cytomitobacter primus TaxID=2066024 RepID=A0A5C0UFI7_9PROT|nr:hypothetical protein [Candidatus Cytomitobacter primus]QEK38441.1 hypothetical protein FZC34_00715 [Candidatus Cytomitobacter primus]